MYISLQWSVQNNHCSGAENAIHSSGSIKISWVGIINFIVNNNIIMSHIMTNLLCYLVKCTIFVVMIL